MKITRNLKQKLYYRNSAGNLSLTTTQPILSYQHLIMNSTKYYQRRQNEKQALEDVSKRTDIAHTKAEKSGAIVIQNIKKICSRSTKTIEQQGMLWAATKRPNIQPSKYNNLRYRKFQQTKAAKTLKINDLKTLKFYTLQKIHK